MTQSSYLGFKTKYKFLELRRCMMLLLKEIWWQKGIKYNYTQTLISSRSFCPLQQM